MSGLINSLLILLFFGASALFSGLETGGYLLNRIRLRFRARHGNRAARRLQSVLGDAHRFIFTVLIGNNIANYLLSREVTQLYSRANVGTQSGQHFGYLPWSAEAAATLTLMLPLFFFAELLPKNIFRHHPNRLMYSYSGFLALADRLLRPLTVLLKGLFNLLTGGRGRSEALSAFTLSLQGLREYFSSGVQQGSLSDRQHGMIDNLVSMHRIAVRDIMQPAASLSSISEKATVQQVIELMRRRHVDQVAVYRGSVRNLSGLISLFDLMDPQLQPSDGIKPRVRKLVRLSADLPLTRAFRRLRSKGTLAAAVMDRSTRTVGLLHLRDIARYIVRDA